MSLKVYYLDDEKDLGDNFVDYFSSSEIEVTAFTDSSMALAAAKISPPDVLFIDYRLAGATGDEVAMTMAATIPKYLVTGDISISTEYKFKAVFNKPYKPEDIQKVLDAFLKSKSDA